MKKKLLPIIVLTVLCGAATAQENKNVREKVDSVLIYQKQLMDYQQRIYSEVKYVDPLEHKLFGIEFNPAYLILASANKDIVISGTLSLFGIHRKAEVAFPIYYSNAKPFSFFENHKRTKLFTLDAVYRRFLGAHQNGFYFSIGVRYAHLNGDTDEGDDDILYEGNSVVKKTNKFGAMAGIGYRYFTKSGFYWGTSLNAGRYFSGNMHMAGFDGGKTIIDIELLKFGFTF